MSTPPASTSPPSRSSPGSPTASRVDHHRRVPFPHTVEVAFDPETSSPELLFNFTHSARSHIGDVTKAAAFHASSGIKSCHEPTDRGQNKIVRVAYPAGLKRLYFARAGNVGLEFGDERSLKEFQEGILGVGHVVVREEMGIYRCYLGDKVREYGREGSGYHGGEAVESQYVPGGRSYAGHARGGH